MFSEEPDDGWLSEPEDLFSQTAAPSSASSTPSPTPPPSTETPMYEPDMPPGQEMSSQWDAYDNTSFPPSPGPSERPQAFAPPGRQYAMYRQQPTWQHASLMGVEPTAPSLLELALTGMTAIAASAAIGYAFTGSARASAGSALAMMGVLQIPAIFSGSLLRPAVGVAAIAGAYYLSRDFLNASSTPNWEEDDEEDDEEDEEDDAVEARDAKSKAHDQPAVPPKANSEPAPASPWVRPIR